MLSKDIVISSGDDLSEISFIDYAGKNFPKRVGIVWLTDFKINPQKIF